MTTKNADTLKREREALRDATARKIQVLVPGFDIDLFRDQLVVHAIPGTGCRSIDVRFGTVDLDRPGEFGVRVNVPATGSFDPTDRADGTFTRFFASPPLPVATGRSVPYEVEET